MRYIVCISTSKWDFLWTRKQCVTGLLASHGSRAVDGRYGRGTCLAAALSNHRGLLAREVLKELDINARSVWAQVNRAVGSAVTMVGVVLLIQWALPESTLWERAVRLITTSVTGATVYGVGVFWRGGLVASEMKEVVGWILRPRATASLRE